MSGAVDSERVLIDHRVVVCVGTGGVGKTTVAAAIGIEAARRGARALVLTIDPARRLAGALGLDALGAEPQELPESRRADLGIEGDGQLFAMMLDMKRTFDDLVERFAEDEAARRRILDNPIYQHVSDALAGSGEYAAMEKVHELLESRRFDLVVLDTPPSQNAIDFLDAPRRLLEFIDSRLVRLLIHPAFTAGRFGLRLFRSATDRMLGLLERMLGMGFLKDLSEFLLAFESMAEGFRLRATRVREMLLGPDAGFVLVAAPSFHSARNAEGFLDHLAGEAVPLVGLVINRVRRWPGDYAGRLEHGDAEALEADRRVLADSMRAVGADDDADALARAACEAASEYDALVQLDRRNTESLRRRAHQLGLLVRGVPELPEDVHDVTGLLRIGAELFASGRDGGAPARGEPSR